MDFRDDTFIDSSPEDAAACSQPASILQSQSSLPTQAGPIEDSQATLGQHLASVMVVGTPSPEAEMRRLGGTPGTPLHRLGSTDSVREPSLLFAPTPDIFAPTPEPVALGLAAASSADAGPSSRRPRAQEAAVGTPGFSQSGPGQQSMASQESCREPAELFPSTPDHFEQAPAIDGAHRGLPVHAPAVGASQSSVGMEMSQFFGATPDSFEQEEPPWTQAPTVAPPEPAVLLPTSAVPLMAGWPDPAAAPDAGAGADATGAQAAVDAVPLTPPPTGWSPHRLFTHAVATVAATAPDNNPRRRLRQKRSGPTTQTPERKRRLQQPPWNGELTVAPATEPVPAVVEETEEEEWKRRQLHRRNGIESVKRTKLYQLFAEARLAGCVGDSAAPQTPDPTDREVRKRRWENSMQSWRNGLKDWGRASGYNLCEL